MDYQIIDSFYSYNERRYSRPWVCKMVDGKFDFSEKVGSYSANDGEAGDLVVTAPETGQVYGYGQKDRRRGSGTIIRWAKWTGEEFVPCDKFGREKKDE